MSGGESQGWVILPGSHRAESATKAIVGELISECKRLGVAAEVVDIYNLPLFDQYFETEEARTGADAKSTAAIQTQWEAFREKIRNAQGVICVTPEHNRSMSAALKSAIDIASRPYENHAWKGKPLAAIGVGAGNVGGFYAVQQVEMASKVLDCPFMPTPEAYIHTCYMKCSKGTVTDVETKQLISNFVTSFRDWTKLICTSYKK